VTTIYGISNLWKASIYNFSVIPAVFDDDNDVANAPTVHQVLRDIGRDVEFTVSA
jgi:hypothetical protein